MASLWITPPESLRRFVEEQARRGGFSSAGDYVQSLIWEARREAEHVQTELSLLEALRGGPAETATPETWAEIEREGLRRLEG